MPEPDANITALLRDATGGGPEATDALMRAIYDDLRRIAGAHMRHERADHTLQPTALVNEAYVKLVGQHSTDWKDRAHFFAVASLVIRRLLVDHARERNALRRGGDRSRLPLDMVCAGADAEGVDLLALDDALRTLGEIDPRQAKIVELRFFGGLTIDEVAEVLSIGKRTVDREWQCARAWLYAALSDEPEADAHG